MRDLVSRYGLTLFSALGLPVNKTSNTATVGVDLAPYNAAMIYILAGTWTDGTHTFKIQESDDNSTFTDVVATDLVAWSATSATVFTPVRLGNAQPSAITSAATAVNQRIGYMGGKRYIRATVTVGGSPATGAQYDVLIEVGEARNIPSAV